MFGVDPSLIPSGFTVTGVMHWNGTEWVDVFASFDQQSWLVSTIPVDSFSPFVLVLGEGSPNAPEPASLALLALGSQALIRRRKK